MQIAIGTYDHTRALKDGSVTSPKISFDFVEVSPITRAFRHMAAGLAYDVSEMALATYMLARVFDKPIVGLPIVLVRSSLLPGLVTAEDSPIKDPRELAGKTLGIRSYTQTSGVWVRGILQDAFGLDLSSLNWVTFEGAHLDEYSDPPNVSRAAADKNMADMVQSGELAAAIGIPLGRRLCAVVPDAAQAEADWAQNPGSGPSTTSWWSSKTAGPRPRLEAGADRPVRTSPRRQRRKRAADRRRAEPQSLRNPGPLRARAGCHAKAARPGGVVPRLTELIVPVPRHAQHDVRGVHAERYWASN